jgi:hypothetical protein
MAARGRNKWKSITQADGTVFAGEVVPSDSGTSATSVPQLIDAEIVGFACALTEVTASATTMTVEVTLNAQTTSPTWVGAYREPTGATLATMSIASGALGVIYFRNPFPAIDSGDIAWRATFLSAEATTSQSTFGKCYVFARESYPNESLDA